MFFLLFLFIYNLRFGGVCVAILPVHSSQASFLRRYAMVFSFARFGTAVLAQV